METEQNPILTVTQISLSLKSCVEQVFSNIRVKGEVVGVKKAASGHIYFSLKDADSVLSAVCWRGKDKTTIAALEDGLEIVCLLILHHTRCIGGNTVVPTIGSVNVQLIQRAVRQQMSIHCIGQKNAPNAICTLI